MIDRQHQIQSRHSFWAYRQYINPKLKKGWWVKEICYELQQFWDDYQAGKRPKLVIMAPPQTGKSTAIIDFISWMAGQSNEKQVIFSSFSDRLGVRANLRLQRTLRSEKYCAIFPNTRIGDKCTQDYFEYVGTNGCFRNTTIKGSITGETLDIGVIDDPIKGRLDANSETTRNATWEWFADDFSPRFEDDGALLIILTRWHVDDPVGRLLDIDDTVRVLKYPAIATEDDAHRKIGDALFPEHKSLEFLRGIEQRMYSSSWQSLYQQEPTLSEGNFFNPDKMPIIEVMPTKRMQYVRAWDLASSTNGDWTVGVKMCRDLDRWIIVDVKRFRSQPHEVRQTMLDTAIQDGKVCKIKLPQDPGQAGKDQIMSLTAMLCNFKVISEPVTGRKETRAEPLADQTNVGNVYLLRSGWNHVYIDELRSFPAGKYDDQVDASADAYNELTGTTEIEFASAGPREVYSGSMQGF